jgi:hypothetical protein
LPREQPKTAAPHDAFESAWELADTVPGWLTKEQARRLWDEASALPPGSSAVEIGSHKGRSTLVLGRAVQRRQGTLYAIDPFVEGKLFGGQTTKATFHATIARADLDSVVVHVDDYSTRVRQGWTDSPALLYIDGKHDYWTCSDDLAWRSRLDEGAAVLVHDAFSSIGVTTAILAKVLFSRDLAYEGREGSLATFRRRAPRLSDRGRIIRELPWWLRNVAVKVLLRLRLRPVARVLGHTGNYDPY